MNRLITILPNNSSAKDFNLDIGFYKCTLWVDLPPEASDKQGILLVIRYTPGWTHHYFFSPHDIRWWEANGTASIWRNDWKLMVQRDDITNLNNALNSISSRVSSVENRLKLYATTSVLQIGAHNSHSNQDILEDGSGVWINLNTSNAKFSSTPLSVVASSCSFEGYLYRYDFDDSSSTHVSLYFKFLGSTSTRPKVGDYIRISVLISEITNF